MIYLLNSGPGRFGNRLFDFHFIYQLKEKYDAKIFIGGLNQEVKYFDFKGLSNFKMGIPEIITSSNFSIKEINPNKNYLLKPSFLGEFFHDINLNINKYIDFKKEYKKSRLIENQFNVAIHFRGTDFHKWNSKSILDSEYYINSIKEALLINSNSNFILYSDDYELDSYKATINFLEENNFTYMQGRKDDHYIFDIQEMSCCDMIISTPSTFCIWGGILGKEKKIIHSKTWMEYRIENNDIFWMKLNDEKSLTYNLYKKI